MKIKFWVIPSFFIIALGLYLLKQKKTTSNKSHAQPSDQLTTSTSTNIPDITIKNFTFKEYEKNRAYALIVNALDGKFFHATDTVLCETITCTIFNNNNEIAHINAQSAIIKRNSKEIFFKGRVHGNFKDITLDSTDICYNFASQVVSTEKQIIYRHAHALFSAQQSTITIKDYSIAMQGGVYSEFFTEPRDTQPTQ